MSQFYFYGIGTNKEEKSEVYGCNAITKLGAEKEFIEYCKKTGLTYEFVRPVVNKTIREPSTTSKDWKEKFARNRGKSF